MIAVRSKLLALGAASAFSILAVIACSDSESNPDPGTSDAGPDASHPAPDSGSPTEDSGSVTEDSGNEPTDAGCGDACPQEETSVETVFGAVSRTLTHAHFGGKSSETDGGLHVEVFQGTDLECPSESSPTPERMLVLDGIPESAAAGQSFTLDDGIEVGYFDFVGDQTQAIIIRATSAKVTIVGRDSQASPATLSLDLDLKLEEDGTAKGRAHAEHCDSLD